MALFAQIPAWMIAPAAGVVAVAAVAGGMVWQSARVEPSPVMAALPAQVVPLAPAPEAVLPKPAAAAVAPSAAPVGPAAAPPPVPATPSSPALVAAVAPPAAPRPAIAAPPAAPETAMPGFDIVRVEPSGDVLVAGRGQPGATIEVTEAGKVLATGIIDAGGQFVLLPSSLKPGSHLLALRMTAGKGSKPVQSAQSVAVSLADKASGGIVVALAEPGKPTEVLSAPAPLPKQVATLSPAPVVPTPEVAIRTVEIEQGGGFFATGMATPGASVRLYLNGSYIAAMQAGANGRWSLKIARGMQPGHYAVRADQVEPSSGAVIARAEVPFDYPASAEAAPVVAARPIVPVPVARPAPVPALPAPVLPAPVLPVPVAAAAAPPVPAAPATLAPASPPALVAETPAAAPLPAPAAASSALVTVASTASADVVLREIQTATVVRGDSLWRISRQAWGQGIRYTQIYEANSGQIRDPRLIFPGQVLVVPASE